MSKLTHSEKLKDTLADEMARRLRQEEDWSATASWLRDRALDYGFDLHLRYDNPEIWSFDLVENLRGPRIIAVASNPEHLWSEQHGIKTRTKRNHSRTNSGRLTIGGNYSRSP